MNGATALINTLADCGVEFCIANPGTSEMHLVQALDAVPRMKSVLALFEGVCTGAADGVGRMTGKPATTLLHPGPGMANGIANLHNARRGNAPMINIIGNHPNYHTGMDYPSCVSPLREGKFLNPGTVTEDSRKISLLWHCDGGSVNRV